MLEALGKRLVRTGPLGSGHAMKALNNFCGAAAYATTAEALAIGQTLRADRRGDARRAQHLDRAQLQLARSCSRTRSWAGRYASNFALALLAKDVSIAASLAQASGLETPVVELVSARWSAAADALPAGADHSEAHKAWWDVVLASDHEPAERI